MVGIFNYGIDTLTIGNAIALANGRLRGLVNADASKKIRESHDHVRQIVENNKTVYGINTGFGILANTKISEEDTATLQYKILQSHVDCGRVQDPYSLRCMPQVHGASRNAWLHLKELTEIELNAVTDNPIILGPDDTISGGNFHGQPLALPLDYACFAASELGNISDRRCYLLLEGKWGLPMLLMKDVGLNSGFMIPQYTTAALVTENKTLCFPSSADSIPTSLGQEDHVSMGSISGRKLNRVLDNLEFILAIELLSACQAIEFRRPLKSSELLEFAHGHVREHVSFASEDRIFADDINKVAGIIKDFSFVEKVNEFAKGRGITLNDNYGMFQLS